MTKRRRPQTPAKRAAEPAFWGRDSQENLGSVRIRPTPDPGAVPRSLGDPPLAINAELAQRHLAAVYEEAVKTASALAAANGLLDDGRDG